MEIRKTDEIRSAVDALWEKFLFAGVCADVMLGEVAEHLYVEPPRKILSPDETVEYAAVSGFADDLRDAAARIYDAPETVGMYGELSSRMRPEDFLDAAMDAVISHMRLYDAAFVRENPYTRAGPAVSKNAGRMKLAARDTLPYEFIETYREGTDADNPFWSAELGFFTERVSFPALLENDRVWMSIVVSEIESMRSAVRAAKGRAVTYGLGLGYYAAMAAMKPEVTCVTAVELSPEVIRLFRENILPRLPQKEKIEIVRADAYEFIKNQRDGAYDFAYADFWAGTADGPALYAKLLPLTARFRKTRFEYWIESRFIDLYFRPVVMKFLMKEVLGRAVRLPKEEKETAALMRRFENFLKRKKMEIRSAEEIGRLLETESMTALVREGLKEIC